MNLPIKYTITETTLEEFMKYHDINSIRKYCSSCPKYNTIWSCPDFSFKEVDYLKDYNYAYIIGAKIFTKDVLPNIDLLINNSNNILSISESENTNSNIVEAIYNNLRFITDDKLLKLEEKFKDSTSLIGGRCMICTTCSRVNNIPCIHPDKLRYSLEGLGFDVSKTTKHFLNEEILWFKDKLPEFTLTITALLTKDKIDSSLILKNMID